MADYNAIKKQTDEQAQKAIAKYNEIRDKEVLNAEKIYNDEIVKSDAAYEKVFDKANVDRIVNEKFAAEAAANMGQSKSGYNRNRQTQIKLAYGNAVLETELQKTAAANTIRQQLAQYKAGVETEKSQYALATQQSFDQLAQQSYNTQYAAEKEAAAKITAARISAANNQEKELNDLYDKLNSADYEGRDKQKALLINNYCKKYGVSPTELLNFIEMSEDDFNKYIWGVTTPAPSSVTTGAIETISAGVGNGINDVLNGKTPGINDVLNGKTPQSDKQKNNTTWDYSKYSFK
ncbi:MAG: hypothetical protein E7568_06385 [Ruminococcaceae bacterium]|nr:hypothetical protein [Oscillospiraceae bacterium]